MEGRNLSEHDLSGEAQIDVVVNEKLASILSRIGPPVGQIVSSDPGDTHLSLLGWSGWSAISGTSDLALNRNPKPMSLLNKRPCKHIHLFWIHPGIPWMLPGLFERQSTESIEHSRSGK